MLKPKFKEGDVVWGIKSFKKDKQIQCPDCKGKKAWEVKTPAGEEFTIPCYTCERGYQGCYGTITIWEASPQIIKLTIGSVRIDTNDERPISYMCNETGVGSGTIHYEDCLSSNRTEALAIATKKASESVRKENERNRKIYELGKKRSKRHPCK